MSSSEDFVQEELSPVIRVDLHCHSDKSDGYYSPYQVAQELAREHVQFAALTDHMTDEGCSQFARSAARYSIPTITGAEVHGMVEGVEIHMLAYGFFPEHPQLPQAFSRGKAAESIIEHIHQAGGIVVLAHPFAYGWSIHDLARVVSQLKEAGLDGLEVYYGPYTHGQQKELELLADKLGLLTSGGSDYHGSRHWSVSNPGVDMPVHRWREFRQALGSHSRIALVEEGPKDEHPAIPFQWQRLVGGILLPSILVMIAFLVLVFGILIPTMEDRLLERKRQMVIELSNSATSILFDYNRMVQQGLMTEPEARVAAAERIRSLRYGPQGKDYFWITDMHPIMVMHPYRSDLEGQDLTDFVDPEGVRLFVQFVESVRVFSTAFVRYVWQWQDDPDRMLAKESYVRRFSPWDWIIGTGIYLDDVRADIERITGTMVDVSFIVVLLAVSLLALILYQSYLGEKKRRIAEEALRQSHDRYRTMVESASGGVLLLTHGHCSYANAAFLTMTGYSPGEIAFLDVYDLIDDQSLYGQDLLGEITAGTGALIPREISLKQKNGRTMPALLSATKVYFSGQEGLLLTLQDVSAKSLGMDSGEVDPQAYQQKLYQLIELLYLSRVDVQELSRIITRISDSLCRSLIRKAVKTLGPPPCSFAFVALGSQARMERVLYGDQDNALIYQAPEQGPEEEIVKDYFLRLAKIVCIDLNEGGYKFCPGEKMAMNPQWNMSLDQWKKYFSHWIQAPSDDGLANCNVFFDWRCLFGDEKLVEVLEDHIAGELTEHAGFFSYMAYNTVAFTPVVEKHSSLNCKEALLPLINFSRLYSLKHGLRVVNTLERTLLLEQRGAVQGDTGQELRFAYEFLVGLRFQSQMNHIASAREPDNTISVEWLSTKERNELKKAFSLIQTIQNKVRLDFRLPV